MSDLATRDATAGDPHAAAHASAARPDALAATIEFAPLGIAHFDRDGRFHLANRKLCEMLGYSRAELLRRNFLELTFPDDVAHCLELTQRLGAGEIPGYRHEKRFVRADGTLVWTSVTVSAVRGPEGDVDFFVGIAEDVTEQRRADELKRAAQAQLQKARDEAVEALEAAEKSRQLRDEMVAIVAHDLRNPLHTIALAAATLESTALDPQRRERLHEIVRQTAVNMGRLLDDLLDVSRLESGTFAIEHAPVSPQALAVAMDGLFDARAAEKEIAWESRIEPGLAEIEGDARRLEQVLSNLIGNALKFTPRGGRISLDCRSTPGGVEFVVADTGCGIAPQDLERLFDRFWKSDPASHSGAGLGLAIARGIVEAHGGRIWAESEPGAGTQLRVVIPTASPR